MIPDTARLQALQTLAERLVAIDAFAGIGWRIMQHGRSVSAGCVGHADHARVTPLRDDTLYRLYSMTKPIVSVAALQLIEAGRLQLDDPISRWLPGFARMQVMAPGGKLVDARRLITIEDLLTHRAGLSYDFLPDCPVADLYREADLAADGSRSLERLVSDIGALPLAGQPGVRFTYSYATDLLAHVLERVHDTSLRELLRRELLLPLGMDETDFGVAEAVVDERLAAMFGMRELGEVPPIIEPGQTLLPLDVERSYPSNAADRFARGGIGLFSTINDYTRLAECLQHGRAPTGEEILSAPMLDLLWRNRLPREQRPISTGRNPSPGYGWGLIGRIMVDLGESMHLTVEGEGGWAGAASTWFWCDRANGITGLVFAQFLGSVIPLGPLMQAAAYQGFVTAERR